MRSKLAVTMIVPKKAFEVLSIISEQNVCVKLELDEENREITLSADMTDFPNYSNDGGWAEINDFLEGVE